MKTIATILAVTVLAACSKADEPRPAFKPALERHLSAISQKDFETYATTLTHNPDGLQIIFPDGETLKGVEAVADFHREWFTDDQWVFEPEIERIIEGEDVSLALVTFAYRDTPDGEPRYRWLVLAFRLEDGEWRLVHDQNTVYPEENTP